MMNKRLYYEYVYKLSLVFINFGFSLKWWWLVNRMLEVRKSVVPKLLSLIIPKEVSEKPIKKKRIYKKRK